MKFEKYLIGNAAYNRYSFEEKKKSRYIIDVSGIIFIFFIIMSFVQFFVHKDYIFGFELLFSNILVGLEIFYLRKEKILIASSISLIYIFLNIVFLSTSLDIKIPLDTYRIAIFLLALIFSSNLLAINKKQILILAIAEVLLFIFLSLCLI